MSITHYSLLLNSQRKNKLHSRKDTPKIRRMPMLSQRLTSKFNSLTLDCEANCTSFCVQAEKQYFMGDIY